MKWYNWMSPVISYFLFALLLLVLTATAVIDLTPKTGSGSTDERKGRINLFLTVFVLGTVVGVMVEYGLYAIGNRTKKDAAGAPSFPSK